MSTMEDSEASPAPEETAASATAAPPASAAASAASAAAAAGHPAEDLDAPMGEEEGEEGSGSSASVNEAGAVSATADTAAVETGVTGDAADSKGEEEEGPTDEDLLEAIRSIPASVEDIRQLTPKQVKCGFKPVSINYYCTCIYTYFVKPSIS